MSPVILVVISVISVVISVISVIALLISVIALLISVIALLISVKRVNHRIRKCLLSKPCQTELELIGLRSKLALEK